MTSQRLFTPEEGNQVIAWYQAGHSAAQIAEYHGITPQSLKSWMRRLGVTKTSKTVIPDQLSMTDQVAELLSEGFTIKQIANELGITRNAAKNSFKRIKASLGEQAR